MLNEYFIISSSIIMNPQVPKDLSCTPAVGENITLPASPTAGRSTFLVFSFLAHSTSFFSILKYKVMRDLNSVLDLYF